MVKILIGLLIIACIAPLFIKGPDGEPIMTLDDWKIDLPESLDELLQGAIPEVQEQAPSAPATVYRWQDESGQWHFSNTPPEAGIAEEMQLNGDINIMEAYVAPEETAATETASATGLPSGPMTATPDQVREMMETVTNLQETIDQRKAEMDKIVTPAIKGKN
ncbi:MAG: DUF4124 domain-containing protein [Gammaproteobacteria bacterium]|jgi:hypothetical protein|nr:DUF4124 domain-containing protein [Gammaproteobacteria bacterium]MBT4493099.1 DUF4124 domain-containing protein [Gammaproteobacteria bacterium]MBT7372213.1 DUF4124 domain-containing protein [Gammaproteobacteria bacterium]